MIIRESHPPRPRDACVDTFSKFFEKTNKDSTGNYPLLKTPLSTSRTLTMSVIMTMTKIVTMIMMLPLQAYVHAARTHRSCKACHIHVICENEDEDQGENEEKALTTVAGTSQHGVNRHC